MKKLAFACCLVAVSALAQGAAKAEPAKPAEAAKPVEGAAPSWKPSHVSAKADKKGVEELFKAMDDAAKAHDFEAMLAHIDFPVMLLTDSAAGVPSSAMLDKATFVSVMTKSSGEMPKDAKIVKKTKITFITDSLAFVEEDNEMTLGKAKDKWVSGGLVELKDGKWMVKARIAGGWGDLMPKDAPKAAAEPAKTPAKAEPAKPAPAAAPTK